VKKLGIFVLVLILIGPAIGLACSCCGEKEADFSSLSILKEGQDGCCGGTSLGPFACRGLKVEKFVLNPIDTFLAFHSWNPVNGFSKIGDFSSIPKDPVQLHQAGFSPPVSQPLYLTLRILRV
jgi:hypothetical protein